MKRIAQIREIATEYPKIFALILVGIILIGLSGILVTHAEWQIDLFAMPFIWRPAADGRQFYSDLIANGISAYSAVPATDFLLKTTVGSMMDTMLAFIAIGWVMGMVGVGMIGMGIIMLLNQRVNALKLQMKSRGTQTQ